MRDRRSSSPEISASRPWRCRQPMVAPNSRTSSSRSRRPALAYPRSSDPSPPTGASEIALATDRAASPPKRDDNDNGRPSTRTHGSPVATRRSDATSGKGSVADRRERTVVRRGASPQSPRRALLRCPIAGRGRPSLLVGSGQIILLSSWNGLWLDEELRRRSRVRSGLDAGSA